MNDVAFPDNRLKIAKIIFENALVNVMNKREIAVNWMIMSFDAKDWSFELSSYNNGEKIKELNVVEVKVRIEKLKKNGTILRYLSLNFDKNGCNGLNISLVSIIFDLLLLLIGKGTINFKPRNIPSIAIDD